MLSINVLYLTVFTNSSRGHKCLIVIDLMKKFRIFYHTDLCKSRFMFFQECKPPYPLDAPPLFFLTLTLGCISSSQTLARWIICFSKVHHYFIFNSLHWVTNFKTRTILISLGYSLYICIPKEFLFICPESHYQIFALIDIVSYSV